MITTDDDRCADLARRDQVVEGQACLVPLAIAEPADSRRQSLEADLVTSTTHPFVQPIIVWEEIHHSLVGCFDVGWIAGQRNPTKWTLPLTEQRPDIGRHETGELEGSFVAAQPGLVANRVAVVEDLSAAVLERDAPCWPVPGR